MELVCEFENLRWYKFEKICYTSSISSSSIKEPNTSIRTINGNHLEGKSDKDVEVIRFRDTTVNYFPQGLNKIFPNLKAVLIHYCELKSITRKNLDGLENIQILRCGSNKITTLPDDLFRNMKKLIDISFRNNDLGCLSSKVFKPILNNGLKFVDFSGNRSIDAYYSDSTYTTYICRNKVDPVAQLMAMIDEECNKPVKNDKEMFVIAALEGFKELWTTGRLSDITIVTDTEKFKAHKVVLANQSSVFTSIFEDKMKDRPSDEIQMKNINSDVVNIFLEFLYTGEIKEQEEEEKGKENKGIEFSNLMQLFALAAKFKVENLMTIVEEMIIDNLNDDNSMDVFELACLFNCDEMKISAFRVIQSLFDVPPLKDELLNQPEVVKKLFEAKRNYESMVNEYRNL